jgi:D-alanine-D-alanine ligase
MIQDFLASQHLLNPSALPVKVWVLAPHIESQDDNIDYYYDFSQSIAEYTKVFNELKLNWHWQPVTMNNFRSIIDQIESEKDSNSFFPIVLNLCDGDEINGTPGISVVRLLEEKDLVYTGADEHFYAITTSKIPMKKAFDDKHVANAAWMIVNADTIADDTLFERLGYPVIVKPAVSGGSMGVGIRNVVENKAELENLLDSLNKGYRGWNLNGDGMIAEQFINGREFTTFIIGSADRPEQAMVYKPVERVFHPSLPDKEKFLSFDRLWEIYEEESAMPGEDNFYEYQLPEAALIEPIKQLSWDAFCATGGKGYTRVDLRMDNATGKLYVLEVNAQCGISEDENFTSIGAILRLSGNSFTAAVGHIIEDAIRRAAAKKTTLQKTSNPVRA